MKKILFLFISVVLSLSLSLHSFAYTNSYTFSSAWTKVVFLNSRITTATNDTTGDVITANHLLLTKGDDTINLGSDSSAFIGLESPVIRSDVFDISIPMNIYLNEYNSFAYTMYLLLPGSYNINISATAVTDSKSYPIDIDTYQYDGAVAQAVNYNSSGGISGTTDLYSASRCFKLDLSFDPSDNFTVEYITIHLSLSDETSSFVLGSVCSTDTVVLPDHFESYIASISNKISLTNSRILTLINELRSVSAKIDNVLDAIDSSSAGTSVLTQYLSSPSEEQQTITDELNQLVEDAQNELEVIKEIINTVEAPTAEDLVNANKDGHNMALDVITDSQFTSLTQDIFSRLDFIPNLILTVLAVATISYVFFGKKV